MAHTVRNKRLSDEKKKKFLGIVAVGFEALEFSAFREGNPVDEEPDWDDINSWKKMFVGGCSWSPDEVSHQIPALIDRTRLDETLSHAGIKADDLRKEDGNYVKLDFPAGVRIQCLRGRHRVLAADAVLEHREKRCIVRLYSSDVSEEAKRDLIEEQSSERQIPDGEFFYRISLHWETYIDDVEQPPNKWMAMLTRQSEGKAIQVSRLLNKRNPFTAALGHFHKIPAMFWGIKLGLVGDMISMPCREELLDYLQRIEDFWLHICQKDEHLMRNIDVTTIKAFNCRAPGANGEHYRSLRDLFNDRKILRNFSDEERDAIWARICEATKERSVPTLHSFFDNLKYLSAVAYSMERLKDPCQKSLQGEKARKKSLQGEKARKESLRQGLSYRFGEANEGQNLLQVSETHYKLAQAEDIAQFELGYRTLWTFCLRWYPALPRGPTNSKRVGAEKCTNQAVLFRFALLAHKIGFRSERIAEILRQRPQAEMLEPLDSHDSSGKLADPKGCGKPNLSDLAHYRDTIFVANFHAPRAEPKLDFSHFFVQRSLYLDLFWKRPLIGMESLLENAVSEAEHDLCDAILQSIRPDENVGKADQALAQLREEANRLKTEIERQKVEHLEYEALLSEMPQLREKLEAARNDNTDLQNNFQRIVSEVQEAERLKSNTQQQLSAREQEKNAFELEYQALRQQVQQETENLKCTKKQAEKENTVLSETQQAIQKSEQERRNLEKKKQELELQIYQFSKQVEDLRRQAHVQRSDDMGNQAFSLHAMQNESASDSTLTGPLRVESTCNENKVTFQVQMKNGKGSNVDEEIYVTAEELEEYITGRQKRNYKVFDRHDKVLVPHTCFELLKNEPREHRVLVFKPKFEVESFNSQPNSDRRGVLNQDYNLELKRQYNQDRLVEKRIKT